LAAFEKGVPFTFKHIPLSGEVRILESNKKDPKELVGEYPVLQYYVDEGLSTEDIIKLNLVQRNYKS